MLQRLKSLLSDISGTSAIEYALIASLISVVAAAGFEAVGSNSKNKFEYVETKLSLALPEANSGRTS